jgi:hypothetical protein
MHEEGMHLGRIIQAPMEGWSTTIRHSRPCNTIPLTIMEKITEESSHYDHLEQKSVPSAHRHQREDQTVALAVAKTIPQLERLFTQVWPDAARRSPVLHRGRHQRPPRRARCLRAATHLRRATTLVNGIIAGGDTALRHAVEHAEDDEAQDGPTCKPRA